MILPWTLLSLKYLPKCLQVSMMDFTLASKSWSHTSTGNSVPGNFLLKPWEFTRMSTVPISLTAAASRASTSFSLEASPAQ